MYDKVKLWIDRAIVGDVFPHIANYLDGAKQQTDLQTGEVKVFGSLDGLKITIHVCGISIIGSFAKFLHGSNVYSLDRHTTANAIEKVSDSLHIQAGRAKVTGVEFGTNFLMRHHVADYLSRMGDMPRLCRYHFDPSTLYYKGTGKKHPKAFAFYDKIAHAEAEGMECPKNLMSENLLRYEMRLDGRLAKQLRVPEVAASTLYDHSFYRMMIKRYQESYFAISKLNQIKTNVMSDIRTVRDAFEVLVARLLSQADQAQISGFLDELKGAGVFDDRKNYTRLKNKIKDVATKANITVTDELIRELDDDIKNCGAYA